MINASADGDASSPAVRRRCRARILDRWDYPSEMARHYSHVLVAIVLFVVAQLLTCAWDEPFWKCGIDFPGEIVAMVFVWLFMWAIQLAFCHPGAGLERLYYRYLKAPTEVLNKHMSIGFTVPFLSLISQSFAGESQVGLLTTAFVISGVLNAGLVYTLAYHMQLRLTKLGPGTRQQSEHVLDGVGPTQGDVDHPTRPVPTLHFPRRTTGSLDGRGGGLLNRDLSSRLDRFRKHVSDVSTLCTLSGYASDYNGANSVYGEEEGAVDFGQAEDALRTLESGTRTSTPEAVTPQLPTVLTNSCCTWARRNIFLTLSAFVLLVPGLLLSFLQANDFPLDVGFLFTVWLTFTSAQTRVKQHLLQYPARPNHKKVLTAITTLLNPVLWTSLSLLCYGLAKAHIRGVPAATIVAQFKTGTTVSDLIAQHFTTTASSPPFGAGDLATSILNAGIVSWGLKLFEYRAPLLSRGGLTVLLTSAIAAAMNVVAWPILASRVLGVRPSASALSFAARSVTIALGGPAVARLGGDAGVNAVGVVVNGIVFQLVAGCFVGGDGSFDERMTRCRTMLGAQVRRVSFWRWPGTPANTDEEKTHARQSASQQQQQQQQVERCQVRCSSDATQLDDGRRRDPLPASSSCCTEPVVVDDDVRTVAAGVTIGINAAAMGTAHLYEQASGSAAYSALAMTVFGLFTVLFTVPSPMVVWLRAIVEA